MITQFPAFYVFGSYTDIGKTLFSAGICLAATENQLKISYIKPIQTGLPISCDASFIRNLISSPLLTSRSLFAFHGEISPHRVSVSEKHITDEELLLELKNEIEICQAEFLLVEGAGGVASPSLDGNLQCNIYRKIRLPIIFIGDSKLGGISTTISSIELALARGFEISCLLIFESEHKNSEFLKTYYEKSFPVFTIKQREKNEVIINFYQKNKSTFLQILQHNIQFYEKKFKNFEDQFEIAKQHIWWPFVQHKNIQKPKLIDSAFGDYFEILDQTRVSHPKILSKEMYDASASWWTQSIGHGQVDLTLAASAAAGRFGHVMFPGYIHEPAIKLTQKLLETVGKDWAKRVFFADNGSTAIEIALKMAFRKSFGTKKHTNPFILGIKDSFHGETHAAMDATNPNSFKLFDHWYTPRGIWLDYPKMFIKNKKFYIRIPSAIYNINKNKLHEKYGDLFLEIKEIKEAFSAERIHSAIAQIYKQYLEDEFASFNQNKYQIGACIMEGVVQGSGGFQLIDPLFQKLFVEACQQRNIPVIIDEVFSGLWRLGEASTSAMLQIKPDISCYGKILTGGLLPLSAILAQEHIFEGFLGDDLSTALLHGHSYTANPIGCAVAAEAIDKIQVSKHFNPNTNSLNELWDKNIVNTISCLKNVERIYSLGTLLAIELQDNFADYSSIRAKEIIVQLQINEIEARPLGNVIYIIAGFNTKKSILNQLITKIYELLRLEGQ